MIDKSAVTGIINNADFDKKGVKLATKSELRIDQDNISKLPTFDSSYFRDKSHFEEDDAKSYLVFQPMYRYYKKITSVGIDEYIYF